MKLYKRLSLLVLVLLALVLVGCKPPVENPGGNEGGEENPGGNEGGEENPGGNEGGEEKPTYSITVEELETAVANMFEAYKAAEHGKFELVITNGETTSTVKMTYNYFEEAVDSMEVLLINAQGTMSCHISEEKAYINRYDASKNIVDVKGDDAEQLFEEYSFAAFNNYLITMLCPSFFDSLTVDSYDGTVAKATLNIGSYDISSEEETDELITIFDGIKEKESVNLEVLVSEGNVTGVKTIIVGNGVTSTIELKLLGTSAEKITIAFPDFSEYTK